MDLSGELAKSLLELAPDATIIVDATGSIVFANAQVEQTFGYARAELTGSRIEMLLPERFHATHPRHRADFGGQPKPRPMGAGLQLFGLHKDGREFPVEISLSPVRAADGLLVVAAVRDATVRQDREERLIEANRSKSRFLAAASHDLRQPLTTLNLLNRVATRHAADNPTLRGILERQQLALDSMSDLLGSVLDISKLDSGAVTPNPIDFPINEVFERLLSNFEPQAAEKNLTLDFDRSPEAVHSDPELLRRLLGNLVSNAIRYTNRGGVSLACVRDGRRLRIEVRDTGIGIPERELARIFDEFYQVDRGTRRPEGLGLGLSIVRRLATLLRCDIAVDSTPGRGTVFKVAVPAAVRPAVALTAPETPAVATSGFVLVVDDEPAVAEATSLLLEVEGFTVKIASCEREALEVVANVTPDLIVSDYHLRGGETGIGVVRAVRECSGEAIPAVFVTGDTARSALETTKIENARVLPKPMRADELLAIVQEQVAARRSAARS